MGGKQPDSGERMERMLSEGDQSERGTMEGDRDNETRETTELRESRERKL